MVRTGSVPSSASRPARARSCVDTRSRYLCQCDPLTGEVIRASKVTALRYERPHQATWSTSTSRRSVASKRAAAGRHTVELSAPVTISGFGYDYVHAAVDDHTRLAYAEILEDETGPTCAAFLIRAAGFFASYGITVREVITDNAKNYYPSGDFHAAIAGIDARTPTHQPHCPWQNGKVERFNRTVQVEWAYRQVYNSNDERTAALAPWLDYYNTRRRHSAIGGQPPISRLSPTS